MINAQFNLQKHRGPVCKLIFILMNSANTESASDIVVVCVPAKSSLHRTATSWSYLMDEVPDVSGVRGRRSQWVLVIVVQGPLVQASDPHLDAL